MKIHGPTYQEVLARQNLLDDPRDEACISGNNDNTSYAAYQATLRQKLQRDLIIGIIRNGYKRSNQISDESWMKTIQHLKDFAILSQNTVAKVAKLEMIFRLANWCIEDIENISDKKDILKLKDRVESVLAMIDDDMIAQRENTQELWKLLDTIEKWLEKENPGESDVRKFQ